MVTTLEEYMNTGVIGAYQPRYAVKHERDGKVFPQYRDTCYTETEHGLELNREMIVGGRTFIVRSIFPSAPTATPTQQMLRVIDSDLKNP